MFEKIKSALKNYFDPKIIILIFGALCIIPLSIMYGHFEEGLNSKSVPLPIWLCFIFTGFSIISALFFILITVKKKDKLQLIALLVCLLLVISNFITTFIEPNIIVSHIYSFRLVYYVDVSTELELVTRFVYCFHFIALLLYIYISVFLLYRVILNKDIIKYLVYVVLIMFVVSVVFSLITEFQKYGNFLKQIFSLEFNQIILSENSLTSFFLHKNINGMFLIAVVIVTTYGFTMTKNKLYIPTLIFIGIYSLLTFSKSSIIIIWVYLIYYFFVYNVLTYKDNAKTKLILLTAVSSLLVVSIVLFVSLYFLNNSFKDVLDRLFISFGTYNTRQLLWENVIQIITPDWMMFGRGHGIVPMILHSVSDISLGETIPHEHSFIYAFLGEGGVFLLIAFLSLLVYVVFLSIKAAKNDIQLTLISVGGVLAFLVQSLIENNYYLIFVFAAIISLISYSCKPKKIGENKKNDVSEKSLDSINISNIN